jgi:hypothetical protein
MRHSRQIPAVLAIAAALAGLSLAGGATAARVKPRAHTASVCNIKGKEQSLGPTYVTYVEVRGGASCSFALHLVKSYYQCRVKHGGVKGICSGVDGFRCKENRYAKIVVQYDASVACTRGSERVFHKYTQFT